MDGKVYGKQWQPGPAKSLRFDFSITDNNFDEFQAGYNQKQ